LNSSALAKSDAWPVAILLSLLLEATFSALSKFAEHLQSQELTSLQSILLHRAETEIDEVIDHGKGRIF